MYDRIYLLGDPTVLELSQGIRGPYCGKRRANLGVRVIKAEPPEGEAGRFLAPSEEDTPHLERGAPVLYLNAAKESITLALAQPRGQAVFRRLVSAHRNDYGHLLVRRLTRAGLLRERDGGPARAASRGRR